MLVCVSRDVEV